MERLRKIFFDELTHKYTDEYGNNYTSNTTLISKYYDKFDKEAIARACEKIGKNPNHKDFLKYRYKSAKQLIHEWELKAEEACARGNKKHNYFETSVKESNNYRKIQEGYTNNRIYTVNEILDNRSLGLLNIEFFIKTGIDIKYPTIFAVIKSLCDKGYYIYSEIGTYISKYLISGLIDILFINFITGEFIILDWKTNESPIVYKSGFYKKDNNNNITDEFEENNNTFNHPISHVPASIGHKYSMQLSGYAVQVEDLTGLKYKTSVIAQIMEVNNEEIVKFVNVLDLREEYKAICNNHYKSLVNTLNTQNKLF